MKSVKPKGQEWKSDTYIHNFLQGGRDKLHLTLWDFLILFGVLAVSAILIFGGVLEYSRYLKNGQSENLTSFIANDSLIELNRQVDGAARLQRSLEDLAKDIASRPGISNEETKSALEAAKSNRGEAIQAGDTPLEALYLYDNYGRDIFGQGAVPNETVWKKMLDGALAGETTTEYGVGEGACIIAVPVIKNGEVAGALTGSFTISLGKGYMQGQYAQLMKSGVVLAAKMLFASLLFTGAVAFIVKKRSKEFRSKSQLHDAMSSNLPGGVLCRRLDKDFRLEFISQGFLEMIGYTEEDLRLTFGGRALSMIYPKDREQFIRTAQAYSDRPGSRFEHQYRLIRQDSVVIWVLDKTRVERGADGRVLCYSNITDITSFKQEQKSLSRLRREMDLQRECYAMVCDLSRDLIFYYDVTTKELFCNKSFREYMGSIKGHQEWVAAGSNEHFPELALRSGLLHPEDEGLLKGLYRLVLDGEETASGIVRLWDGDSDFVPGYVIFQGVRDYNGETLKVVGRLDTMAVKRTDDEDLLSLKDSMDDIFELEAEEEPLVTEIQGIEEHMSDKESALQRVEWLMEHDGEVPRMLILIEIRNLRAIGDSWGSEFSEKAVHDLLRAVGKILPDTPDPVWRTGSVLWVCCAHGNVAPEQLLERISYLCRELPVGDEGCDRLLTSVAGACYTGSIGMDTLVERVWLALEESGQSGMNCWSLSPCS